MRRFYTDVNWPRDVHWSTSLEPEPFQTGKAYTEVYLLPFPKGTSSLSRMGISKRSAFDRGLKYVHNLGCVTGQ